MPVYVEQSRNRFDRMNMSHMLADSLEELHAMADRIGLRRAWFQPRSTPHYDVSREKRALAVQSGVKEIDRRKVLELIHAGCARTY
jgi:hypothetical protein